MKAKLEELLVDKKIFKILNLIANSITDFRRANTYINIISNYYSKVDSEELFGKLVTAKLFDMKIIFECEDETYSAEIIEKRCDECEKKVCEHEYHDMFKPRFSNELSEFNSNILNDYFDVESKIVLDDIQSNLYKVVPFIGSGISKTLGLPLWIEMFGEARNKIPTSYQSYFDMIYETKDIDRIIETIYSSHPLVANIKDLKKEIIVPAITRNVSNPDIANSIIPNILTLDAEYIITTNYDRLIERANGIMGIHNLESRNIDTFQGFESLEGRKFIFHLHGTEDNWDSMVVTKDDYDNIYGSDEKKKIISGLVNKKSMLFLGFSMNDKYFSEEFGKICDSNKGYSTNYYVMINGDRQKKDELLESNNVRFINIKTKNKEDFEVFEQYSFMIEYILGNIFVK